MGRIQVLKVFTLGKTSLMGALILTGVVLLTSSQVFAQPPSCNIDALRSDSAATGWDYLASVTTACGSKNPNNLGGHMLMLHIDPGVESRGIARQIAKEEFDRFSIILVTGKTDPLSGEFIADSMMVEVSNISNPFTIIDDPLTRLGGGFFVLKMGLDGKYLDGFRHKTGINTHLRPLDAAIVIDYLEEYWNGYFDSADFIASSDGLAW